MSESNKTAYTRTEGEYEALERQLEEERSMKIEVADRLKHINSCIPSCYTGVSQALVRVINQLKEKGDDY